MGVSELLAPSFDLAHSWLLQASAEILQGDIFLSLSLSPVNKSLKILKKNNFPRAYSDLAHECLEIDFQIIKHKTKTKRRKKGRKKGRVKRRGKERDETQFACLRYTGNKKKEEIIYILILKNGIEVTGLMAQTFQAIMLPEQLNMIM